MGYASRYFYIRRLSILTVHTALYLLALRRSLNVHSVHGPVVNPYQHTSIAVDWHERERRSAGGSSGGSGAAVAAGMCDA